MDLTIQNITLKCQLTVLLGSSRSVSIRVDGLVPTLRTWEDDGNTPLRHDGSLAGSECLPLSLNPWKGVCRGSEILQRLCARTPRPHCTTSPVQRHVLTSREWQYRYTGARRMSKPTSRIMSTRPVDGIEDGQFELAVSSRGPLCTFPSPVPTGATSSASTARYVTSHRAGFWLLDQTNATHGCADWLQSRRVVSICVD